MNLKFQIPNFKYQTGFIAISIIVFIAAVVLVIATTVTFLSIGEAQSGYTLTQGENALNFVEGCTEDVLQKIHESSSYSGGTITRPEGTCSVTVTTGNPNWDVTITTTATSYKRNIQIKAVRGTSITLTSWQEI